MSHEGTCTSRLAGVEYRHPKTLLPPRSDVILKGVACRGRAVYCTLMVRPLRTQGAGDGRGNGDVDSSTSALTLDYRYESTF